MKIYLGDSCDQIAEGFKKFTDVFIDKNSVLFSTTNLAFEKIKYSTALRAEEVNGNSSKKRIKYLKKINAINRSTKILNDKDIPYKEACKICNKILRRAGIGIRV